MNNGLRQISRQYAIALRRYLHQEQEASLECAYELGKRAIGQGLGVLDMAEVHQAALAGLMKRRDAASTGARKLNLAAAFFLEILSPFEATHRGFREANVTLQRLNRTLADRNVELDAAIAELQKEMSRREQAEKDLRQLSIRLLQVQEEERTRISRELHDEVGQALTAIGVSLGIVKKGSEGRADILVDRITDVQQLLVQTMDTVHRFARELRPAMLDELGLVPALRSYLKGYRDRTGLRVYFSVRGCIEDANIEQKTVFYRVAQESLNNVAKHAQATRVETVIRRLKEHICMEVKDNGKSFTLNDQFTARHKQRLGLLGMQERARQVNGDFEIISRPGKGTTVRIEIPCPPRNGRPLV